MKYAEFSHLKRIVDKDNPFLVAFELSGGEIFIIEPAFYTQLTNFKELYNELDYKRILARMEEITKERKRVIFTYDFENPFIKKDGFIYLEFTDVTDSLKIFIEDKSRGSDYGD